MGAAIRALFLVLLVPLAARAQKVDVSNDSITCNSVTGTASFSPPLVTGGTATSVVMHVKGLVAGCTVSGPNVASILSGKLSGQLAGTSNECLLLSAPLTGTLTIRWKAAKATPILQTSSTSSVTNVSFGVFSAPWGAAYGRITLGTSGVTGAFTGGDQGATSSNVSVTSQDVGEIIAECGSPTGSKKLDIGLGQLKLQ